MENKTTTFTKKLILIALFYFLIAILLGSFLRFYAFIPNILNYRFVTHAHSHTALLGWSYLGVVAIINHLFLSEKHTKSLYKILIFKHITIIGMLLSFPFQGYGVISIIFSSLFLISTYWYSYFLLKNINKEEKNSIAYFFLKSGIFFLFFSSLAVWILPLIIHFFKKFSPMYDATIYFFLHFLYNGFIISALISFWVKRIEQLSPIAKLKIKKYRFLYFFGILGSVFLSWTELFQQKWFYFIGGISSIFLIIFTIKITFFYYQLKFSKNKLIHFFIAFLIFKTLCLLLISFPEISKNLFFNLDLIISYLHFIFLGVITLGILSFFQIFLQISFPKYSLWLYIILFIFTELLITYKGFCILFKLPFFSNYFKTLAIISSLFIIPITIWISKIMLKSKK